MNYKQPCRRCSMPLTMSLPPDTQRSEVRLMTQFIESVWAGSYCTTWGTGVSSDPSLALSRWQKRILMFSVTFTVCTCTSSVHHFYKHCSSHLYRSERRRNLLCNFPMLVTGVLFRAQASWEKNLSLTHRSMRRPSSILFQDLW